MDTGQPLEEQLMQEIINLALTEDRVRDDVTTNSLKDYDKTLDRLSSRTTPSIWGV